MIEIKQSLTQLYGEQATAATVTIEGLIKEYQAEIAVPTRETRWTEKDIVLITYGDQITADPTTALRAQNQFLLDYGIHELINTVHLLVPPRGF